MTDTNEVQDDWEVAPEDIEAADNIAVTERLKNASATVPAATFQEPTVTDTQTGWGDDADLMPAGAGGPARDEWENEEEEFNLDDLRVNMSKQEADAASFEDFVPGKYVVSIFKVEVQRSKSEKNFGKPMYNITYKVQVGKYTGAQIFGDYICLWDGALYSYSQLVKALGVSVTTGSNRVLKPQELQGKILTVRLGLGKKQTVIDKVTGEEKVYEPRMQVKGYFPAPSNLDLQNSAIAAVAADPLAP